MSDDAANLGNVLVLQRLITEAQLNEALRRQQFEPRKRLGEILTDMGAIAPEQVPRALAKQKAWRTRGPKPSEVYAAVEFAVENTRSVAEDIDAMCDEMLTDGD